MYSIEHLETEAKLGSQAWLPIYTHIIECLWVTWAIQQFNFWNPQGAEPSQGTSVTPKAPQGREPGQALPRRERPGSRQAWGTLTEQARSEGWSHTPGAQPMFDLPSSERWGPGYTDVCL